MEPDCLVPGRTFPANPSFVGPSVQRQPASRHLPRTNLNPRFSFQRQNLLFNSSHYSLGMHLPDPSLDMQHSMAERPEKVSTKSSSPSSFAALCMSMLHSKLVETLTGSSHTSRSMTLILWPKIQKWKLSWLYQLFTFQYATTTLGWNQCRKVYNTKKI